MILLDLKNEVKNLIKNQKPDERLYDEWHKDKKNKKTQKPKSLRVI